MFGRVRTFASFLYVDRYLRNTDFLNYYYIILAIIDSPDAQFAQYQVQTETLELSAFKLISEEKQVL